MRALKAAAWCYIIFTVGMLFPKQIKEPFPYAWGWMEGKTSSDMTGFFFTPFGGHGKCRIVNSVAAFGIPKSKILFGIVEPGQGGRTYPHLWGTTPDGDTIDAVCPETAPQCKNRRVFAVIDAETLTLEKATPSNGLEQHHIEWGLRYLAGLKKSVSG